MRSTANTQPEPIRVLVADDENAARARVVSLLRHEPDVKVVGQCRDGLETLNAITREDPELVFLDMQMPELDGVGVLEALNEATGPEFIFVTAYSRYWKQAFAFHALDYLRKPYHDERFAAAVEYGRTRVHERRIARLRPTGVAAGRYRAMVEAANGVERHLRIRIAVFSRTVGKWTLLHPSEIDFVRTDGSGRAEIAAREATYPSDRSVIRLEGELAPFAFVRVHRAYLVNTTRVVTVEPEQKGEYTLTLRGGAQVRTGRTYRRAVEQLLE